MVVKVNLNYIFMIVMNVISLMLLIFIFYGQVLVYLEIEMEIFWLKSEHVVVLKMMIMGRIALN